MPASAERTPAGLGLPDTLEGAGFNVAAVLGPERYDDLVPDAWKTPRLLPHARAVLVLGCGGRDFYRAFLRAPEASLSPDPLDTYTRRVVGEAAVVFEAEGFAARCHLYCERLEGQYADFVALARACGIGAPSRLGLLLHPVYGPWLSIRALLLTEKAFPPSRPLSEPEFAPCHGCLAPCLEACPGSAPLAAGFDADACGRTRAVQPACAERCDARGACVVGPEHRYDSEGEAFHMRAAGLGIPGCTPRG